MRSDEKAVFAIDPFHWLLPRQENSGMRVPGMVITSEAGMKSLRAEKTLQQVANVASLPGIVKYSLAMPDIHWGYGFPLGGVAATEYETGVISPGGVGYDINCGVRLLRTDLEKKDVAKHIKPLLDSLFQHVPCGVGQSGRWKLSAKEQQAVLMRGAYWVVERGMGLVEDLNLTEDGGMMPAALPEKVSPRAQERGREQLGTLGGGNHFLEIQEVEEIYLPQVAKTFGLFPGQITLMIHTGSRGLGYQVCDDYLRLMYRSLAKYRITIPDRQLVCAPIKAKEGQDYFQAMSAAANYAWANRQCITHLARLAFQSVLGRKPSELGMSLVYDVAHNIAKIEEHEVENKTRLVCVHRKGATRAFSAGHPELPLKYQSTGQPVLIPGDMGRNSYVLVGTDKAMAETFGSTCHGAGRILSRHMSQKQHNLDEELGKLAAKNIEVRYRGKKTILEEVSGAYKDINEVVAVVEGAGISLRVAKLKPLGVIKG